MALNLRLGMMLLSLFEQPAKEINPKKSPRKKIYPIRNKAVIRQAVGRKFAPRSVISGFKANGIMPHHRLIHVPRDMEV
jgi:hypothetical protein